MIPALGMLTPELDGGAEPLILSFRALLAWSFGVAFFGVFLAVPLRKQVVVREKLVFPSGTATAQVLGVLHGKPLVHSPDGPKKSKHGLRHRAARRTAAVPDGPRSGEAAYMLHREESMGQEEMGDLILPDDEISAEEIVGHKAWRSLLLSFAASASYTVRFDPNPPNLCGPALIHLRDTAAESRDAGHLRRARFRHLFPTGRA